MTSFRMHAPTACIFGLPGVTNFSKNSLRTGLNRIAVTAARNSALRSRAFPAAACGSPDYRASLLR